MSDHDLAGTAWQISPSQYLSSRPEEFGLPDRPDSLYITMRDGCRIAIDVYLPQGINPGATFPAITIFTPYFRRFKTIEKGVEPSPNAAKYRDFFVPRGYALVVIDVRGTGASFGVRESLRSPKEREDSREIADWIIAQPWSNGIIGSTGISYLGAAACFLASTGHPAIKAIAPLFSVSDIYNEQLFPGGMLSRVWSKSYDELMVALDHNDAEKISHFPYFNDPRLNGPQPVDDDIDGIELQAAIREHKDNFRLHDMMPELAFRDEGPIHAPELNTDACSPFYYQKKGTISGVPIYSISGWMDGGGYANGSITRFLTMAGPHDRLLLGPWDHGARTNVSPFREQIAPQFSILAEVLRFFDEHLLGMNTGIDKEDKVHYFSMHEEAWRGTNHWPPRASKRLYLTHDDSLSNQQPTHASLKSYQVHFETTTGSQTRWERLGAANVTDYFFDWSGRDQSHLKFTSTPLDHDIELSGHIIASINLSSSERDAALFVYASEVKPDGTTIYITEGMLRALHRAQSKCPEEYITTWPYRRFFRSDAKLLQPDRAERLEFALLPTSWTLKKGNRLRISIAGADADHFPQIPNGMPPCLNLILGGENGSFVEVPIL